MTGHPLHVGFIPPVDAAASLVAVKKGFAAAEGLGVSGAIGACAGPAFDADDLAGHLAAFGTGRPKL